MKNQASEDFSPQSGNMLVWILIMVALFAALSYAMMQGSRTSATTATTEKARLMAAEIIQYAVGTKSAVKSMLVGSRCTERQISFDGALGATSYVNALSPADYKCHVFKPQGGGVRPVTAPGQDPNLQGNTGYGVMFFSGSDSISGAGDIGNADLWMYIPYLYQSVCEQINMSLMSSTTVNDVAAPFSGAAFTGTYTVSATDTFYAGKTAGCFKDTATGKGYVFYYVLHGR